MSQGSPADTLKEIASGGWIMHTSGNAVTITSGATTDVYTFSDGRVLTITFTDSTKATVSTIERTA